MSGVVKETIAENDGEILVAGEKLINHCLDTDTSQTKSPHNKIGNIYDVFVLHNAPDVLCNMVGINECSNTQGLKNLMIAMEGTNAMVDEGRGVADNGVEILEVLEAGKPEKKKN